MPPKSIYRQQGARHFHLVHRSQRDPLINDPGASQHVLKPVVRKGHTREELEVYIDADELASDLMRANIGEAANYGVFYDDSEYDYMQHLRPFGIQENGVDSTLIEAPARAARDVKRTAPNGIPINSRFLRDIPLEALPSATELTHEEVLNAQAAVSAELSSLQPDMDPHLRQTLEALEDDAFVEDSLDDRFFAELVADGERGTGDEQLPFGEDSIDNIGGIADEQMKALGPSEGICSTTWESQFAKFKTDKRTSEDQLSVLDRSSQVHSEDEDVLDELPVFKIAGAVKCRKAESVASGYSLSSSSMCRNKGLTLLDEQFDHIQKEYASDEDGALEQDDAVPELITSREDFNDILDDFLGNYEILGGKVMPALQGHTHEEKLGTIRKSLREFGDGSNNHLGDGDTEHMVYEHDDDDGANLWDCETILSTTNNQRNRPKMIQTTEKRLVPDIYLGYKTRKAPLKDSDRDTKIPSASTSNTELAHVRVTARRTIGESKDEKNIRKQDVKKERRKRRKEKKSNRAQFSGEKKKALRALANTPTIGIRKL